MKMGRVGSLGGGCVVVGMSLNSKCIGYHVLNRV